MTGMEIGSGVSGIAVLRAADAMLRAFGGDEVSIVFSAAEVPDDPSVQLGLGDPGVQQVRLSPVVMRSLTTSNTGPRRRLELLITGSAVNAELSSRNVASGAAFFSSALGIVYDGSLFHIEDVTTEYFAGAAYLYRVVVVE